MPPTPVGLSFRPLTAFERQGASGFVSVNLLSLTAILAMLLFGKPGKAYPRTHVTAYLVCLLAANTIQATATALSLRWITKGQIDQDIFCQAQGALRQTGNLASAVWSVMIALNLFNTLFLHIPTNGLGLVATLSFGWAFVATFVILGPAVLQTRDKGFYFGISGIRCWITDGYPREQMYLEYLLELLAAGFTFVLSVFIILRVRGNISPSNNRWHIQFSRRVQGWNLDLERDEFDLASLRIAKYMVWYPLVYTIIIVPMSTARLIEVAGMKPSLSVTLFTEVIVGSIGLVNVVIFLSTRRFFADLSLLPEFLTPRKESPSPKWAEKRYSPGAATRPIAAAEPGRQPFSPTSPPLVTGVNAHSRFSVLSISTVASDTPLRKPERIFAKWFTERRR